MSGVELVTHVLDCRPGALAASLELLEPAERAHAGRLRRPTDRARFIARRAALREILGRVLDEPPRGLRWCTASDGRPVLAGHSLRFSASHSENVLAVAVAPADVGVDVERVRSLPDLDRLAEIALSPAEQAVWRKVPAQDRPLVFLQHWTAKEAFLKALGRGLLEDPSRATLRRSSVHLAGQDAAWQVRHVRLYSYLIAVVAGPAWDGELASSTPLSL
jgi:4'-phosphopantetheinyl transferase